ncbi:hypothetical protein ACFWIA_28855 [Streptomyces sp. NPDC127068]|uniref:hypothetical protein n=1 Tax=Streptomyces sp. NPDC127068 TaxID=3347127 RepID=UPI00364CE644
MHPDVHLMMHRQRAVELRREAGPRVRAAPRSRTGPRTGPRLDLRARLGWTLVEWGLRLATTPRRLDHGL